MNCTEPGKSTFVILINNMKLIPFPGNVTIIK